ncbi:MAG TPA: methionine--tRNA ligase subunit beta [Bacillota bacterium]|nr:methionine--tRNA ligase subunit beta [Bacillota bacterium]
MEKTPENIKFSDWQKLDLRVAKILKVEDIKGTDQLYKILIDLGTEKRTIVSGLKKYYKEDDLLGKKVIVFTNLEPRTIRGVESQGMVLAAVSEGEKEVLLLQPDADAEPGLRIS